MKNKSRLVVFGLLAIFTAVYYQDYLLEIRPQVAGLRYNRSVEAEYGVPIKVIEAVDGDTVVLLNGERLRYVGIDTPEEVDERKPVQCFAREAARKNRELVEGRLITFYKDVKEKDIYGRWLGFVYLEDGTFVNLELVREGYAFAYPYPPDISKAEEFRAAEEYARLNRLGLWGGQCTITRLSSGRAQTNSISEND